MSSLLWSEQEQMFSEKPNKQELGYDATRGRFQTVAMAMLVIHVGL